MLETKIYLICKYTGNKSFLVHKFIRSKLNRLELNIQIGIVNICNGENFNSVL